MIKVKTNHSKHLLSLHKGNTWLDEAGHRWTFNPQEAILKPEDHSCKAHGVLPGYWNSWLPYNPHTVED